MSLRDRADTPENFELIRDWLAKCEKHASCNQRLETTDMADFHLPKRVIDVFPNDDALAVKLVLGENIAKTSDCRYLALSHCWGDPKTIPKTVEANLLEHQQRLPIQCLSKTFQDAISVTRKIGLRYLWIDSLCIVQHSGEELEEECGRMHLVYSRAYCTLSAQDSADGSGGLFIPRDIENQPERAWDDAPSGPLSTRGRAYQEHQLSPRIIHFTTTKLVWECRLCVASENHPSLLYRALGKMGPKSLYTWRMFDGGLQNLRRQSSGEGTGTDDIFMRWMEAVETYSARKLSYEYDRLPAISGLASVFAGLVADDYLAGHWQKDLVRSLCWMPAWDGDEPALMETPPMHIPSWSWTAHPGPVQYHFMERIDWKLRSSFTEDRFELLSVKMNKSKCNPFGQVLGGSIQLRGSLAHVQVLTEQWKPLKIRNHFDDGVSIACGCSMRSHHNQELPGIVLLDPFVRRGVFKGKLIHALCLQLSHRRLSMEGKPFRPLGLVLSQQSEGQFRRIGIYGDDI